MDILHKLHNVEKKNIILDANAYGFFLLKDTENRFRKEESQKVIVFLKLLLKSNKLGNYLKHCYKRTQNEKKIVKRIGCIIISSSIFSNEGMAIYGGWFILNSYCFHIILYCLNKQCMYIFFRNIKS